MERKRDKYIKKQESKVKIAYNIVTKCCIETESSFRKSSGASDGDIDFDLGFELQGHLKVKLTFLNRNFHFILQQ